MVMTNEEILAEYRGAKSPQKQIAILADENLCTKKEIVEILREAGAELPGYYNRQPKKKAWPLPETATAEDIRKQMAAEADDTLNDMKALPLIIRHAATEAIATLLYMSDENGGEAVDFKEQVRGILAVIHEVECRCMEVTEDE